MWSVPLPIPAVDKRCGGAEDAPNRGLCAAVGGEALPKNPSGRRACAGAEAPNNPAGIGVPKNPVEIPRALLAVGDGAPNDPVENPEVVPTAGAGAPNNPVTLPEVVPTAGTGAPNQVFPADGAGAPNNPFEVPDVVPNAGTGAPNNVPPAAGAGVPNNPAVVPEVFPTAGAGAPYNRVKLPEVVPNAGTGAPNQVFPAAGAGAPNNPFEVPEALSNPPKEAVEDGFDAADVVRNPKERVASVAGAPKAGSEVVGVAPTLLEAPLAVVPPPKWPFEGEEKPNPDGLSVPEKMNGEAPLVGALPPAAALALPAPKPNAGTSPLTQMA